MTTSPSGAKRVGRVATSCCSNCCCECGPRVRRVLTRMRQRRRVVVEARPGFGRVEAVPIEPPPHQPLGMRQRAGEIVEAACTFAAGIRGPFGERQLRALTADPAEHGVDESGRALLAGLADEVDGVVDRR